MSNMLKFEKQVAVIGALAEGAGIRPTERALGVNRNTIMWLGRRVGEQCLRIMDAKMKNLNCKRLEIDETQTPIRER